MRNRSKSNKSNSTPPIIPLVAQVEAPAEIAEMMPEETPYIPFGVKSFTDLQAAEAADEGAEEVQKLTYQLKRLIENVLGDSTVNPKVPAIQTLMNEFMGLVAGALGEVVTAPAPEMTTEAEALAESIDGAIDIHLLEEAESIIKGPRDPLIIEIALIKPGWGNKRDNHYYPAAMLRRDAHLFEGAKMYTTDHVSGEKSERTEVSVIERIDRFAEDGTPIARAVIFDPDFAEKTRNRAKAGFLNSLHCSIIAKGVTSSQTIDGKSAKVVESILPDVRPSADWVTQAGAGGHALNLLESYPPEGVSLMPAEVIPEVVITVPMVEVLTEAAAPVFLSEAEVSAVFDGRKLAPAVRARLNAQYASAEKLTDAIESELAYLKAVTQSGKPLLLETAPVVSPPSTARERERNVHQVLAHYR